MKFLQALALGTARDERKSVTDAAQQLGGFWNPQQPVRKYDFDPDRAVRDGFKACVWVFACVSLLMRAVGSVPWIVKHKKGRSEADWITDESDYRGMLLEYPNKEMPRQFAMSWMTSHLALNGEAPMRLARLNDREKRVGAIYPLHPHMFSPIAGEAGQGYVNGYEIYERGSRVILPNDQVIFVKLPDPSNILRGQGMLQAAWSAVQADVAGQEWRTNIFERGGIPPGAIVDENIVTDESAQEANEMIKKAWSAAAGDGRPMLFTKGNSWIPFSYDATSLQYLEGREFTMREICTAFGFHPALFSTEASTYDNMKTAIRHYWVNGAIPLLDVFRDQFNLGLLSEQERASKWITYDLSNVEALQQETAQQVATFGQAILNGLSRREAGTLSRLNLERVDGDDVPLVNPALRPLADVAAGDSAFDGSEDLLPKVEDAPAPEKPVDSTEPETPAVDETDTDGETA